MKKNLFGIFFSFLLVFIGVNVSYGVGVSMNNNCGSVAFNDFTCDNPSDKQCAVLTKCMYTFQDIATKKCWFSCKSIMGQNSSLTPLKKNVI